MSIKKNTLQTLVLGLIGSVTLSAVSYATNPDNFGRGFAVGLSTLVLGAVWSWWTSHERELISLVSTQLAPGNVQVQTTASVAVDTATAMAEPYVEAVEKKLEQAQVTTTTTMAALDASTIKAPKPVVVMGINLANTAKRSVLIVKKEPKEEITAMPTEEEVKPSDMTVAPPPDPLVPVPSVDTEPVVDETVTNATADTGIVSPIGTPILSPHRGAV